MATVEDATRCIQELLGFVEDLFVPLFIELGPEVFFRIVRLQVNIFDKLTVGVVYRGRGRLNKLWFAILSSRLINPLRSMF